MSSANDEVLRRLQVLEDIEAIRTRLHEIARGTDRYDQRLLAAIIEEDAVLDMGSGNPISGADFASALQPPAEPRPGRMHLVSNVRISLEEGRARSESYIVSIQDILVEGVQKTRVRAGRYVDQWQRRDDGWKLRSRTLVDEWGRLDQVTEPIRPGMHMGRPAPDDLSYKL